MATPTPIPPTHPYPVAQPVWVQTPNATLRLVLLLAHAALDELTKSVMLLEQVAAEQRLTAPEDAEKGDDA